MKLILIEKKIELNDNFKKLLENGERLRENPKNPIKKEICFISEKFFVLKEITDLRPNVINPSLKLVEINMYCFAFLDYKGYNEVILNDKKGKEYLNYSEMILTSETQFNSPIKLGAVRWNNEIFCNLLYMSFYYSTSLLGSTISEYKLKELEESDYFSKSQDDIIAFANIYSNKLENLMKKTYKDSN